MVHEKEVDTKFIVLDQTHGLIFEKRRSNHTYRLRNPATRQILYLPSSLSLIETKGKPEVYCYVPLTNELKTIYVHSSRQVNKKVLTYNVLRVGTKFTWKSLVSPLSDLEHSTRRGWPKYHVSSTTFYCFIRLLDGIYLDCLDLENESIINIKTPLRLFPKTRTWIHNWEEKVCVSHIEQEHLNICVLEDYKNHKWVERKIVIPLTFLRGCPDPNISARNISPFLVKGNLVYLGINDREWFFTFDTQSKEVKYLALLPNEVNYVYQPCLIPLQFKVKRGTRESQLSKFLRRCLGHCLCRE